jgi:iron(III) transport system substrate-binding protein
VAVLCVTALLAGCSGGRDALTIYSGRDEALVGPLLERFSEEENVDIDIRYGDSADLALLIEEEGESTPADVFFSQSPGAIEFLGENDMLAELPAETTDKVLEGFASSARQWVGITARQRVLVYNSDDVEESELPDSVFDLTGPEYEGRVGLAPPNGSFQDFVTAMRQLHGDEETQAWLEGMVANDSPTFPDNNSIVAAVARGEIEMGLVNHYYNLRYLDEDPDAPSRNYVFPESDVGSLLIPSPVGILSSTEHQEEAETFIDYMLTEESQEYFVQETFEFPLLPGIDPPEELPPLEEVESVDLDIQSLGGGLERTVELIGESGLE